MSLTSQLKKRLFLQAQRVVPQHQLSRVVGKVAASENPIVKNIVIQAFKSKYDIDLSRGCVITVTQNPKNVMFPVLLKSYRKEKEGKI